MVSVGYGFREVIIDEPFGGKWSDVDLNPGGGHGTFHGTKSSDSAGGFSYKAKPSPRQIMQNRFIYWRILGDSLELIESSLDYNLVHNQVRYIFRDTPIVGPISIHENENSIVILVTTVTSVNRFNYTHPNKLFAEDPLQRNKQPSIFQQLTNRPLVNFKSFSLTDHAINVPVPTTVASHVLPNNSGYMFALAYESGGVTIAKLTAEDTLSLYDLRQSNFFTRIFNMPSLRTPVGSPEAVVGLSFFTGKVERIKCVLLVTLSINGRLRLFSNNVKSSNEWISLHDVVVDKRFAIDGFTECGMMLRRTYDNEWTKETPKFVVLLPGVAFKVYQVLRSDTAPPILAEIQSIGFREKSVMDFYATTDYIYILISSPDEETEWEVKSFNFGNTTNPRFNLALLEPPPRPDITNIPVSKDPKEFYMDLIFNKSSFSAHTIYNALNMFESSVCFPKYENDWELTKKYAMFVIDKEIRGLTSDCGELVSDQKCSEIFVNCWLSFYNSCVEYHNMTVKPLGLFYEMNTRMICIIKKSRISFLRQTDLLETLYYFPHCVTLSENADPDDTSFQVEMLLKYLEVIDCIESTTDSTYNSKINKRLKEDRQRVRRVFEEVANLLTEADPHSLTLERRHFIPILSSKLKELGAEGDPAMRLALSFLSSWDKEAEVLDIVQDEMLIDEKPLVTEFFMGSKLGANLAYGILKQMIQHRFLIAKNTMILQSLITILFVQNNHCEGIQMVSSLQDQNEAQQVLTLYFALVQLCERSAEPIQDYLQDKGPKMANILNNNTVDHLIQGKLNEYWPIKLIELYCHSTVGGNEIRSRMRQPRNSLIVSYADSAGSTLWPNEASLSRPFEEFLVAVCQYSALEEFATDMGTYIPSERPSIKQLYEGLVKLALGDNESALRHFRSISIQQLACEPYFSMKILKLMPPFLLPYFEFFELAIHMFQLFEDSRAIQKIAEDAIKFCVEDRKVRMMCSLGFKQAMALLDYKTAYKFISKMPSSTSGRNEGVSVTQEKSALIRTFVAQLLERADVDVLINLDTVNEYFKLVTMTEEVERVLAAQSRLSDPISFDGVYQMVYLYHLSKENFWLAASALLERIIQLGSKGKGRSALEAQRDSYLDILTCLTLVEDKCLAFVSRNFPDLVDNIITSLRKEPSNFMELFDGSKMAVPTDSSEYDASMDIRTYDQVLKECELCIALLTSDSETVEPIGVNDMERRAREAIEFLTQQHRYDHAIKLAKLWDVSIVPIIHAFTTTCVNLLYDVAPPSGDPADYVRYLDVSEIPSNAAVIDVAFIILQKYISKLEKPGETTLHVEVAMELLAHEITLPLWLQESFKKRDVSRLLFCYIRFGDWNEANDLAVQTIDATLGRRDTNEFDQTVNKITPFLTDPLLPYTAIDVLANQLHTKMANQPELNELYLRLKARCEDYVVRVIETRKERVSMYSSSSSN